MKPKTQDEKEYVVIELPKANLTPTSNPNVFVDKKHGELYFLDNIKHESDIGSFSEVGLRKLNERRE